MTTFSRFFQRATDTTPYAYQRAFAEASTLPDLLEAPTGSGKTATAVLGWLWRRRHGAANTRRRQALEATRACLAAGRYDQAWEAIRPLAAQAERDLLVAYRVAQVLTAKQDVDAALGAWQLVRRLDRHHICREQIRSSERALSRVAQPALSPEAPFGRGDA